MAQAGQTLSRLPALKARLGGCCTSTIYNRVERQQLPPPVKISERSIAWIDAEIDEVIAARVRGASDEEVRALVGELVARREAA